MPLDVFHLQDQLFLAYLLVTSRVIGLLAAMPLVGERNVPWQTKVGMSMLIGMLLLPLSHTPGDLPGDSFLALGLGITRELLVGVFIGFIARMFFGAFQFAVNAIDFQTGLSFIQIVSPGLGANLSVVGQLLNTLMLLLFLEMNGHHLLFIGLARSLESVPLGTAVASPELVLGVIRLFGVFVSISFQIALPVVVVLLLIDVAMGVVGRVIPQLNVFMVALPVKIMVGLATLSVTLPTLSVLLGRLLQILARDLVTLLRLLH